MPSHWNAAGQIDGYLPRVWGIFLMPLMTAGITLLLLFLPQADPLRQNLESIRGEYHLFVIGFVAYMLYVYALTLLAALGYPVQMTVMLLPAMGLLFIGIGYLMKKVRRNYFIGIRTPWTLANDQIWDKTHRLGAKTFMAAGVVTLLSGFLGEAGFWLLLPALLLGAFIPVVYSYLLFRRIPK
jgi:uncharacterized membrane protein